MRTILYVKGYAKKAAREGLFKRAKLPKSKRFGLTFSEASSQGIFSGVERAKQLINRVYFDWMDWRDRADLNSMARFYQRFKNCYTPKCEGSMLLWGGRQWLRNDVIPFVKKMQGGV